MALIGGARREHTRDGRRGGCAGRRLREGEVRGGSEEPDDGRVAVVELGHGVEEVSDEPGT